MKLRKQVLTVRFGNISRYLREYAQSVLWAISAPMTTQSGVRGGNFDRAMTVEFAELPYDLLRTISNRIIAETPHVNRVMFDITDKPPGTIEWE